MPKINFSKLRGKQLRCLSEGKASQDIKRGKARCQGQSVISSFFSSKSEKPRMCGPNNQVQQNQKRQHNEEEEEEEDKSNIERNKRLKLSLEKPSKCNSALSISSETLSKLSSFTKTISTDKASGTKCMEQTGSSNSITESENTEYFLASEQKTSDNQMEVNQIDTETNFKTFTRPVSLKTQRSNYINSTKQENNCDEDILELNQQIRSSFTAVKNLNSKTKTIYTPLEQQFMEIKKKYKDAVLFVECGYKYKFFGEDAEIAAKELNIMCFLDHNFKVASIPTHRLHVHTKRLVMKGYKVGVVKQTETAALHAVGDNKSKVFSRQLDALYTKSTLIGEDMKTLGELQNFTEDTSAEGGNNYLMCVYQDPNQKGGITTALVAVQLATGDVIYDEFEDEIGCSGLETRLEHINPAELLLPCTLPLQTDAFIKDFQSRNESAEDRIRLERMEDRKFDMETAVKTILEFYEESSQSTTKCSVTSPDSLHTGEIKEESSIHIAINLSKSIQVCLAALIYYLKDFKLERVLQISGNFSKFTVESKYMKLNGCTLKNLEVFKNETDGREKGSLFWVLNHTRTAFGRRLLKKWISRPLRDVREIESRLEAVTELNHSDSSCLTKLESILSQTPDLERGLCSIFHKKCSTSEFVKMAKALSNIAKLLKSTKVMALKDVSSPLLRSIFIEVPDCLDSVDDFLSMINEKAAKDGKKTKLFLDQDRFPELKKCNQDIELISDELTKHRSEIRKILRHPSIDYCCVSGNEFLIEVRKSNAYSVPASWVQISSTKQVLRYRTPFVEEKYKLLCQQREKLSLACAEAWLDFLALFSENYSRYRRGVQLLAVADCLHSLAIAAKQAGYVRPSVHDDKSNFTISKGKHPIIDTLLGEQEQFVPNDTSLDVNGNRCMIITGPNMGGKSSYIKQVALISIMAQIGSYVPAEQANLCVLDAIYTRMGASDNIYKGRSTFMVELQEASEIMKEASPRSLVILDELGRGTSTHDGMAIAYATLQHFISQIRCLTLFVTHYPTLAELKKIFPAAVSTNHMAFMTSEEKNSQDKDGVTFLYQLVEGVAARSYGLNVAQLAGLPKNIIEVAAAKSRDLEELITTRSVYKRIFQEVWSESTKNAKASVQFLHDHY